MNQYGIVVIGYKNEDGVKRLLNALSVADYDNSEICLIISIDKSEDNKVLKVAQEFQWNLGKKYVITFQERLGLRKHVLCCGEYLNTYNLDAVAIFEDDMMPSWNFFHFMKATTEKYIDDENIAGVSLYTHCTNFNAGERFIPIRNDGDNYFIQCAQSRGQVWFRKQWNEFHDWYKRQKGLESDCLVPQAVVSWPDTSWLKYHIKYCVEKNKYFVYPYISYSTCFGEVGEHVKAQTNDFQVPISNIQSKIFNLIDFNENALKYDIFFENQNLYQYCNVSKDELLVDLYGIHMETNKRYILTKKKLPYKIRNSWGDKLVPHELNLIYGISGEDIILYELQLDNEASSIKLPAREVKKDKMEIYFNILDRWMKNEEDGYDIQDYFLDNRWHHIAIYGRGKIGLHLYHRLKNTDIQVDYFIDKNSNNLEDEIPIMNPAEQLPFVDAVVITTVMEVEHVKMNLRYGDIKNVISIEHIFGNI